MIEFYGMSSPNVTKVTIMLEETGLPYNLHPTDIWTGTQYTPEFERLNPNRKVPIIMDPVTPGKDPVVVFESGAILMYLADKTGKFLPPMSDPVARTEAIQWMMIQMCGIGPMFGQFVHFTQYAPSGNPYGVTRYTNELLKYYDLIEKRLAERPYLGGDTYTIADMATLPWVLNGFTKPAAIHPDKPSPYPNVARWEAELIARPAVAKAVSVADTLRSTLTMGKNASTDQQDRVFNRGKYSRV